MKIKYTKWTPLMSSKDKRIYQLEKALKEIRKICKVKKEQSDFIFPTVWEQILDIIEEVKVHEDE